MKKLSEVCRIVGVTRRTLQEYDKIHLLSPTDKTEAGYWLYDDAAIQKLILIQIFIESGYERKAVKQILESSTLDILEEFDKTIDILEGKKKRIDGMINTIKILKLTSELPESTLRAMQNMDVTRMYREKSFSEYLDESITHSAGYTEGDSKDAEMYIPFWYQLVAIGLLKDLPEDAPEVQNCVKDFYDYMFKIIEEEDDSDDEELTEEEISEAFSEAIEEMVSDKDMVDMLTLQCGEGAADFIVKAVRSFNPTKFTEGGN